MLWTGASRAEHYCALHPDLTQQHCHVLFYVCVWVRVKELWWFQTAAAAGGWGGGVGGHAEAWGHAEKSQLKWRVQKKHKKSKGPKSFKRISLYPETEGA